MHALERIAFEMISSGQNTLYALPYPFSLSHLIHAMSQSSSSHPETELSQPRYIKFSYSHFTIKH